MGEPLPNQAEILISLGISAYEVVFALLALLAEKGIITPTEGLQVIETALASAEVKEQDTPDLAFDASCELLRAHQAMFVHKPTGAG